MRYQPGLGYIPENQQELAGLKRFFKKLVSLDPVTRLVLGIKDAKPAAEAAAAAPIPEMPSLPPDPASAAPVAPPVTAYAPPSRPIPMEMPEEEGPPQPIQASMFSGPAFPIMIGAGILAAILFGKPATAPRSRRRR